MKNNPFPPFYYILLTIGLAWYIGYQIAHFDEYCNWYTTNCMERER